MKPKPEKTPEIRARELFKMVYPQYSGAVFQYDISYGQARWLKLGKFVLSLEKKWAKSKGGKRAK